MRAPDLDLDRVLVRHARAERYLRRGAGGAPPACREQRTDRGQAVAAPRERHAPGALDGVVSDGRHGTYDHGSGLLNAAVPVNAALPVEAGVPAEHRRS